MFKKQFPILIMIIMGFLSLSGYFINNPMLRSFVDNDANQWYMIIAGFAAFLGVVNLLQLHFRKIAYKKKNWNYSILTLLSFFIMIFFGFIYTGLEGEKLTESSGIYNEGELFVDSNNNGRYDIGESWDDLGNGKRDLAENFSDINKNNKYDIGEPFDDSNGNGIRDNDEKFIDGNSKYDIGELFLDGNGKYDKTETYVDQNYGKLTEIECYEIGLNHSYDEGENFTDLNNNFKWDDEESFIDVNSNGIYDFGEVFIDVGNGLYDYGEFYTDSNNNCKYDFGEDFVDLGDSIWTPQEPYEDESETVFNKIQGYRLGFIPYWLNVGYCGNGEWDEDEFFEDSNNSIFDDSDDCICDEYVSLKPCEENELYIKKDDNLLVEGQTEWICGQLPLNCSECYVDEKNGKYDEGESFEDIGNNKYDPISGFIDNNYGILTDLECEQIESSTFYVNSELGTCGDGFYNEGEFFIDKKNKKYDLGESFIDNNYGSKISEYDHSLISLEECNNIPFSIFYSAEDISDCDEMGWCGNGIYDNKFLYKESFVDIENEKYDIGEIFIDNNHGIMTAAECSQIKYSKFNDVPCGNCGDGQYNAAVGRGAHLKDERTMFYWLFDNIYIPLGSTMFALLAFFVASASYRAFKIRNFEATLLLISGILLMLGRVPVGAMIPWFMVVIMYVSFLFAIIANKFKNKGLFFGLYMLFNIISIAMVRILGFHTYNFLNISKIQEWIFDVPATAGARAIMIGIALGVVAQSFRIMTGREKSILGE